MFIIRPHRYLISLFLLLLTGPAAAQPLTQAQINQFIEHTPAIGQVIHYVASSLTPDDVDRLEDARVALRPHLELAQMIENPKYRRMLDEVSKQSGYDDFQAYAHTADRIFSIAYSAFWIELISRPEAPAGEEIEDPFAYVGGKGYPEQHREWLGRQINQYCEQKCLNPEDIEIVGRSYIPVAETLGLK